LGTPTSVAGPSLDNASTAILAGLESGGFIKIDQAPRVHATLALVLAPAPPAKATADSATANKTLLELFAQLAAAGAREVVAGPTGSAGAGGLLGDLRGAGAVSKLVSGVDDIDDPSGRIAAVFALQRQAAGQVGQYGTGPGAQGPLPSPSAS
jgi:hypothetical protein